MPETFVSSATTILTNVVRKLVTKPESVSVNANFSREVAALTLTVSPEDLVAVIGPNGRTSRSLRTIVAALAKKSGHAISLEIRESGAN